MQKTGWLRRACNAGFVMSLSLIILPVLAVDLARGADWPQYRGINRDGISAETGWLKTWPPTEVWRQTVALGFSSVAVSEGRVYTMGMLGGTGNPSTETVYCFDARTGTNIWSYTYSDGGGMGACVTPTVDTNNCVYTFGNVGNLFCFNKVTGAVMWSTYLSPYIYGREGEWGFTGSPLVDGNFLIINAGGGVAVNKNTGANVWGNGGSGGFGSAKLLVYNSQRIILENTQGFPRPANESALAGPCAIDEATGAALIGWDFGAGDGEDAEFYGTNMFFCGGCLYQIGSGGLTALWYNSSIVPPYSTSVIVGDYVYGYGNNGGHLTCACLTDNGVIVWAQTASEGGLMASDGKLICLNNDGTLAVLKADSTGYNTEGRTPYQITFEPYQGQGNSNPRANPVLANGLLYCRDCGSYNSVHLNQQANLICLTLGGGSVTNFAINAGADPNGSIVPSGNVSVQSGNSQTFTITPNATCNITNVVVDGISVGTPSSYTFNNVVTNHTINAYFSASSITNFTINSSAGPNGSIVPSGSVIVGSGSNQTFTISGNTGYVPVNVLVDGSSVGTPSSYTFNNVLTNHTISVSFASTTTNFTINASAGANGSITPSGVVTLSSGSSQTFLIAVNTGYNITNVLVDGSSVGTPSSYTFNNVQTNHTISAGFGGSGGPTGFTSWTNVMKITFSGYNDPETLTNFPALVVLNTGLSGFSYSQFSSTNGYDLRFSADGSTELNYEIAQWNPGGSSYVWVQVPQLSGGSYIWAYWGNPGVASGPAACAINGAAWPTNAFVGVWHMAQSNTLDSTANGNNGTAIGSVTNATGIVGLAQGVSGGSYVQVPDSPSLHFTAGAATISGWVCFNTLPAGNATEQAIIRNENQWTVEATVDGSTIEMRNAIHTSGTNGWTANNDDAFSPSLTAGKWYYFALAYNGSPGRLWNFENGVPIGASPHTVSGTIFLAGNPLGLGASAGGSGATTGQFALTNAIIDEIRVEQVFRSTNWIWATYMTVASNASFNSYGSVHANGGGGNTIPSATWIQRYYPGAASNSYASLAASVASNGMTVWQDYLAGMNPTNPNSRFSVTITNVAGQIVVSVASTQTDPTNYPGLTRCYEIDQCTNLLVGGSWQAVSNYSGIPASGGVLACTNAPQNHTTFYRVKAILQ